MKIENITTKIINKFCFFGIFVKSSNKASSASASFFFSSLVFFFPPPNSFLKNSSIFSINDNFFFRPTTFFTSSSISTVGSSPSKAAISASKAASSAASLACFFSQLLVTISLISSASNLTISLINPEKSGYSSGSSQTIPVGLGVSLHFGSGLKGGATQGTGTSYPSISVIVLGSFNFCSGQSCSISIPGADISPSS